MNKGVLAIIIGPSGCGKGTIIKSLRKMKDNFYLSVSATTRSPRPEDIQGVTYDFKTKAEFEQMIAEDAFFEYAQYVENYYGTPKPPIFAHLDAGDDVLLEIEMQGARQVKAKYPAAVTIFIKPPSIEELRRRLEGRGTEKQDVIDARMNKALEELKFAEECDYVVVNDDVERAAKEILDILSAAAK